MQPYTEDQLVEAYKLREKGASFNEIADKTGIKRGSTYFIIENIANLLHNPSRMAGATKLYKSAAMRLRKQGGLTADMIVTIWSSENSGNTYHTKERLGWTDPKSTDRIRQIKNNIDMYLDDAIYSNIRSRKMIYMEARKIILARSAENKLFLEADYVHNAETDRVIVRGVDRGKWKEEELTEKEIYEIKLEKAIRKIKYHVNMELNDILKKGEIRITTETSSEPAVEKPIMRLEDVKDGEYNGYYLDEIEKNLGKEKFDDDFLPWFANKTGGIFNGKYYVLKEDFEEFLSQ